MYVTRLRLVPHFSVSCPQTTAIDSVASGLLAMP